MKLVIFDMDQTLVELLHTHDAALNELFQTYFGVHARFAETDFAGRSLPENFVALARLKNIPEEVVEGKKEELLAAYERFFARNIPTNASDAILPGVTRFLERLARTDHLVALYTGDSPRIVCSIMEASGLGRHFAFFVAGTEAHNRAGLVRKVLEKARQRTGKRFEGRDIVIIGDSVRDVAVGKEFNALTIAVTTGLHSWEELAKYQPDYLLESMEDTNSILKAIG
jgi:phosphoglycolate phosphatase-like HAD superfamily hydrolase